MATRVIMPAFGTTQTTGVLLKWFKREGETVAKGEPLMEVETDKSTVEVAANATGVLLGRRAAEGDTIPVGQAVAIIGASGETLTEASWAATVATVPSVNASAAQTDSTAHRNAAQPVSGAAGRPLASPAARRIARQNSLDIGALRGSGPGGAVLARDFNSPANDSPAGALMPLNAMRRIIGARMSASKQSAPHFYIGMDVDMSAVTKLRNAAKERGAEVVPSINDFILEASARALKDFPAINSSFTDRGIQQHGDINIGIAVALDEGLVVPVIRNADQLDLTALAKQSRELADKAQNKKLFPLDYEGGTFTISNLGMLGVDSFIAIINPPQAAILAVGRVAPRVIAEDDAMAIRQMMTITLSADHRVADGAVGARFLQSVKKYLETGARTATVAD